MGWIIAILIILLVLVFIWNIYSKDAYYRAFSCFYAIVFGVMLYGTLTIYNYKVEPTTLDIYQGETTLEITYRDSIPIDTIVVFKPEFKK